jgi:hypothetical protein
MAEHMVRCVRCHEVFDAEDGPCTKCGTPYTAPRAQPEAFEGLYTERYAPPPDAVSAEPVVAMVPPRSRTNTTYMIWGGIGLVGLAVVIALVVSLGFAGGVAGTPAPLHGVRPGAMVTASLPPTVSLTLKQLSDPNFSAHVSVQSHVKLDPSVAAKGQVITISFDGIVSGGNQWGTLQVNSTTQDTILVNGQGYSRTPPSLIWKQYPVPPYRVLSPVFGLKTIDDLVMIGQETKDGRLLNHLQTTNWWSPDISRLAFADFSQLRLPPDVNTLDLWVTLDGTPVSAKFSGTNMAGNTALVDIEVDYTFTNVGAVQAIIAPGAVWTESPGPSMSGAPSASPSN